MATKYNIKAMRREKGIIYVDMDTLGMDFCFQEDDIKDDADLQEKLKYAIKCFIENKKTPPIINLTLTDIEI